MNIEEFTVKPTLEDMKNHDKFFVTKGYEGGCVEVIAYHGFFGDEYENEIGLKFQCDSSIAQNYAWESPDDEGKYHGEDREQLVWAVICSAEGHFTHDIRMIKWADDQIEVVSDIDNPLSSVPGTITPRDEVFRDNADWLRNKPAEELHTLQYTPTISLKAAMLMKYLARDMGFKIEVWSPLVDEMKESVKT